jgi:co-chaperonin GroES (HSP10)|tara:strand:+ start:1076 stop:1333 length:258 start_codon:yes stop_codon:yes gene_type:complete
MKPIGKYILIEPTMEETETESGILLTMQDNDEFRYRKATVVESGTEVTVINSGDTIYYDNRAGYKMMLKNKQYSVIRESDVVVVE